METMYPCLDSYTQVDYPDMHLRDFVRDDELRCPTTLDENGLECINDVLLSLRTAPAPVLPTVAWPALGHSPVLTKTTKLTQRRWRSPFTLTATKTALSLPLETPALSSPTLTIASSEY